MMHWDVIEGNWPEYRDHIRAQWGKLTNDQLDAIAGNRERLADRIQQEYRVDRMEADMQIRSFQKFLKESGVV
jgi:uncharacterized protein YjbJ (UPF0337 family)